MKNLNELSQTQFNALVQEELDFRSGEGLDDYIMATIQVLAIDYITNKLTDQQYSERIENLRKKLAELAYDRLVRRLEQGDCA